MYRRFGSRVTMLERSERILKKEDEDIASEVHKIFLDEDIDIRLNAKAVGFRNSNNKIKVVVRLKDREETLECSHVLLATGRRPDTDSLNLLATGVNTDKRGFIHVDNQLQTNVKGLYALGDVNGGPAFTPISYHDHLILYDNVVNNQNRNTNNRLVPYCMYIDPQLGRVGITEQDAKAKNLNIKVATLPMAKVARAIETSETRGIMKAVVDAANKNILGASILGAEGGEIMSIIEMAIMGGVAYDRIRDAIFAHPTYAESLNNLFGTLDN
jgi:pyruvate/2-oxoglutarate dehydrogenase complex dihydrolipoamide dehydrogenase (E3) component